MYRKESFEDCYSEDPDWETSENNEPGPLEEEKYS